MSAEAKFPKILCINMKNEFYDSLPERSKGIRFFIDWYIANVDKYDIYDPDLDVKLYNGYVEYWKTLG